MSTITMGIATASQLSSPSAHSFVRSTTAPTPASTKGSRRFARIKRKRYRGMKLAFFLLGTALCVQRPSTVGADDDLPPPPPPVVGAAFQQQEEDVGGGVSGGGPRLRDHHRDQMTLEGEENHRRGSRTTASTTTVHLDPPPTDEGDAPRHLHHHHHHQRLPRHLSHPHSHTPHDRHHHHQNEATLQESVEAPPLAESGGRSEGDEAEQASNRETTQQRVPPSSEGGTRTAFATTAGTKTVMGTAASSSTQGEEGMGEGGITEEAPSVNSGSSQAGGSSDGTKRMWGAAAASTGTAGSVAVGGGSSSTAAAAPTLPTLETVGTDAAPAFLTPTDSTAIEDTDDVREASTSSNNKTRAFVVPKQQHNVKHNARTPPDGFALSARVYIDPLDKLAHFDTSTQHIPYWDCGHAGSTTSPLPLKSAYFRHALTGATSWSGTDGKHAVLVVTLSDVAMELNSGASKDFPAGSVILLEDVLLAGHKMRPLHNNGVSGVSVLFLTLPQPFVHTGREHISLPTSFLKPAVRDDPCPNKHPESVDGDATGAESNNKNASTNGNSAGTEILLSSPLDGAEPSLEDRPFPWTGRQVRRTAFALVGVSLSTLAADFLGKTAPLWLAVGVGGTCFVAAGTWAIASGSDALWMAVQWNLERRKLGATRVAVEDEPEAVKASPR